MNPVIITQTLISIQGEGISIGKPILLIRTNGCNIKCSFCDTWWTNEKINANLFDKEKNNKTPFKLTDNNIDSYVDYTLNQFLKDYNVKTVLFTGGEPLLHSDFIDEFIHKTVLKFQTYEVETNGILLYKNIDFIQRNKSKIQLNISPKISEFKKLYNENFKKALFLISTYPKNNFLKFVYTGENEKEILDFIEHDDSLPIMIQPLTPPYETKNFYDEYRKSCLETLNFCLKNNLRYSPREHVFLFGDQREEFKSLK